MSMRINLTAADPAAVATLVEELDLPHFIAATLVARGIDTAPKARRFLAPSLESDWANPYDIENMEAAVDRIVLAIQQGERILVYGDFDLDGVSATTLMTRGLRACSGNVIPFIPLRFEEGYGLSHAAIERLLGHKPQLLITVDNGIAAKHEVEELQEQGVDVVITDHHEPADLIPEGVPVVDPKCGDNPSSILAGAGVALKVVQAVGSRFGKPHLWRELIDLAALGTVADLMPMRDQNRALVAEGIRMINESPRPCIAALLGESGFADKPVSSSNLSFTLVPRLNAAGRMGNAQLALDLLLSDDFAVAAHLAAELEQTNTQRRTIESELAEVAMAEAERVYDGSRALVVAGKHWHEGVKGIVASRLTNRYGVPSILFTIEDGQAHGSGRSVGDVNLFQAVSSCQHLLTRFGGHHAAVGVTLAADALPEFKRELCAYMDTLPAEDFIPKITVDAQVDLGELTLENVEKLELLAPFGQENTSPHFLAHGVVISSGRAVGTDKNHLSCILTDGVHTLSSIMFHCPDPNSLLNAGVAMDAVFELQIDIWKGRRSVKAVITSLKPLSPCPLLEASLGADKDFVSDLITSTSATDQAGEECGDVAGQAPFVLDRTLYAKQAASDPVAFRKDLIQAFLGEGHLHEAQEQTLRLLDAGASVFTVMGTGQGKSLIFHLYAIERALKDEAVSVFIYPLRALVADQAFHLEHALESFGVRIKVLTGASTPEERAQIQSQLQAHEVDIVMTTPEYFDFHIEDFARLQSIQFVVIDEAHHVSTSKAGFRPSYKHFGKALQRLGNPQVLALTATADTAVQQDLQESCGITECVFDDTARGNLIIDDKRNIRKRERYLVNLVARGEKTLIYVNSRLESVTLVRELRKQEPHIASLIGFYNAGLSRAERKRVEDLFRVGKLQVLVATSAFGEGIDIPAIRHVVLYHLPFSEVEFNQMSGRAGRDGQEAHIHLLFGKEDARINTALLDTITPNHTEMASIYRTLRALQRQHNAYFALEEDTVVCAIKDSLGIVLQPSHVGSSIPVFEELGLLKTKAIPQDNEPILNVYVVDYTGKVELTDSVRYREGMDELDSFIAFKDWVLGCSAEQLQQRIQHPLLPSDFYNAKRG